VPLLLLSYLCLVLFWLQERMRSLDRLRKEVDGQRRKATSAAHVPACNSAITLLLLLLLLCFQERMRSLDWLRREVDGQHLLLAPEPHLNPQTCLLSVCFTLSGAHAQPGQAEEEG
jgi:hypothetical protein